MSLFYGQVDYFSGADLHGVIHNDANAVHKERYVIMQKTVKPLTVVVGLTSTRFPSNANLVVVALDTCSQLRFMTSFSTSDLLTGRGAGADCQVRMI